MVRDVPRRPIKGDYMTTKDKPKLTQEFAYKVTTDKAKERFPDHKVVGLNLRVMKSGAKAWVILYRKPDRSSAEMKIGTPDSMTLAMAREVARGKLAEVSTGADPIADKKDRISEAQAKKARTLEAVTESYRASEKYLAKKPNTQATYNNSLDNHILPELGKRPIEEIKRADVAIFLDELAKRKTSNVANQAQSALSVIMSFALRRGLVDFNPVIGAREKTKTPRKDRPLSDESLSALWEATGEREGVTPLVADMLRLLMLLPVRAGELTGMRWDEVDFENGMWTVPKERMKGNEAHEVPLGDYSLDLLKTLHNEAQKGLEGAPEGTMLSEWVFTNRAGTGPMARDVPNRAMARIRANRALPDFSPHDLRHTCATSLAGKIPGEIIERVLSHKVGTGRAIINYDHHEYREEKRRALEAWEQELLKIVGQNMRPH